jgi:ribose 5-phosphate isomerase A
MDVAHYKQLAAEKAVDFVRSGMVIGLGEGSTAVYAVRRIAQRIQSGNLTGILGVPCSVNVEAVAGSLGIPLTSLDDHPVIDLTIDGADEVNPRFELIKGGGGALLREKMVAQASQREIIVVDESKLSDRLGTRWAVPIEVLEFGWRAQVIFLSNIGGEPIRRCRDDGTPFRTDQGNFILDTRFGPIDDAGALNETLNRRAGIVEHGLFIGLATDVIVAGAEGIRHLHSAQS